MAEKIIISEQFKLKAIDFVKGLILAVVTSVITVIQVSLEAGKLEFNWQLIGTVSLSSAVAYMGKKFFEKPQVTTVYNTNQKANEVGSDISN